MSSTTLPVCPKTGSTSPSLTVHLCLHTVPGNRECARLDVTDYLPALLPYDEGTFDLVLAFSVFTHTSWRASVAALEAIRTVIKPDGLLVLTIRPREFWAFHQRIPEQEKPALLRAHDQNGFAFRPSKTDRQSTAT